MNKALDSFLKKYLNTYKTCKPLAGDASTRTYLRISTADQSYIACMDPQFKGIEEERFPYFIIFGLFKKIGIPVPQVYATDNQQGFLLLQDVGDSLLESYLNNMDDFSIETIYENIIDFMIQYQLYKENKNLLPYNLFFDREKLMFEFNFFIEYAIKTNPRNQLDHKSISRLKPCFEIISTVLDQKGLFVLNHRDLHSRNIIVQDQKLFFIDFQDARMGLPQYDLVSILKDSYYTLPSEMIKSLIQYSFENLSSSGYTKQSQDEFYFYFQLMALQRNIKALGTFYYQLFSKKNNRYKGSIKRTKGYLRNDYLDDLVDIKEVKEVIDILSDFLSTD